MTCPTCGATDMTDFCTECGEVFETVENRHVSISQLTRVNFKMTRVDTIFTKPKSQPTMTIDITDKEIEAICFAYTHLQFDHILNHNLQPKPKAHLLDAINTLGTLVDRIEQDQKKQQQKPSEP